MAVPVTVAVPVGVGLRLLGLLDDGALRREHEARDGGGVGQRGLGDLDRVDDAVGEQVAVLAGRGVQAVVGGQIGDLGGDDVALLTGVGGDPAQRLDKPGAHDGHTGRLVAGQAEVAVERRRGVDESRTATGDDALLDRRAGGRDGVLDAVLALLELDLGGRADLDDADAAGKLGQPLLQLLAVPVGVGVLDLLADLRDAGVDVGLRRRHRGSPWWCPW